MVSRWSQLSKPFNVGRQGLDQSAFFNKCISNEWFELRCLFYHSDPTTRLYRYAILFSYCQQCTVAPRSVLGSDESVARADGVQANMSPTTCSRKQLHTCTSFVERSTNQNTRDTNQSIDSAGEKKLLHIYTNETRTMSSSSSESSVDDNPNTAITVAAKRLDEAATRAVDKVFEFASVDDPYDVAEDNPWCDPDKMMKELRFVRDELMEAWHLLKQAHDEKQRQQQREKGTTSSPEAREDFRVQYMDMVTEAFGDVLEGMRQAEGDKLDVDVLVDCLQSGMDLLNDEEREGFFEAFDEEFEEETDDAKEELSIHELRRKEMGLDVPVSG